MAACWSPEDLLLGGMGCVYRLAGAAAAKDHRLGCLSNRTLLSHSLGGWKSLIKALGAVAPEAAREKCGSMALS